MKRRTGSQFWPLFSTDEGYSRIFCVNRHEPPHPQPLISHLTYFDGSWKNSGCDEDYTDLVLLQLLGSKKKDGFNLVLKINAHIK